MLETGAVIDAGRVLLIPDVHMDIGWAVRILSAEEGSPLVSAGLFRRLQTAAGGRLLCGGLRFSALPARAVRRSFFHETFGLVGF